MHAGKERMWAGLVWAAAGTAALALAAAPVAAQSTAPATSQTAAPQPQNTVPNAPAPQTLTGLKLNTINGVAPAVPQPETGSDAPDAATTGNGGVVPASSLPSAPVPSTEVQDDGPPPDLPAAGQGAKAFITVPVNFVQVPFTVKDSKGHLVAGLTWRDVRVYENGLRQQLRLFTTDPFPLSVALVIDQSVTYDTMEKINDSLAALQGAFTPYDEVSVFTYNNGVTRQTGFTAAQSARLGVILDRSKGQGREPLMGLGGPLSNGLEKNNLSVDPNTNARPGQLGLTLNVPKEYHTLNDAILEAARETMNAPRGRRRIVYVISDGKEYGSKTTEKQLVKYLQTNNIEVYATLVGDSAVPGLGFLDRIHLPLTMRDDELPRIAAATGGQCDPEFRPRGIQNSFAHITEQVRNQYTVGYYTHASPLDERFRRIEVRVLRPNLTVIAKDGYYPSAADSRPSRPVATVPSAKP